MTAYHGGKQKLGKRIAETIYNVSKKIQIPIRGYCEPFIGMCGVYKHIPELFKDQELEYKGGDSNTSLVLMWKKAQRGWNPPTECAKEEFKTLKYDGESTAEKGFLGHAYGFGGQYFGSYRLDHRVNNSANSAAKRVHQIGKTLKNAEFLEGDYRIFSDLENYIIYCDPPYSKRNEYYTDQRKKVKFDNNSFWEWVREMSRKNIVFISEYKAPPDFVLIDNCVSNARYVGNASPCEEKLFIHNSFNI
jgi:DNA adenine methylase